MKDAFTSFLHFMYNPITNSTVIGIKGKLKTKFCAVRGEFKSFDELPEYTKEEIKECYAEVNDINPNSQLANYQTNHLNNAYNPLISDRSTLGNSIVELNVENATLLKYIKELYGEFIENDLSTEDKLNAKQLMIKEWLEK